MKTNVRGLHLWLVNFSTGLGLWITTARRDEGDAMKKAQKERKCHGFVDSKLRGIEYQGTLDA